jgi:hypothetical protein
MVGEESPSAFQHKIIEENACHRAVRQSVSGIPQVTTEMSASRIACNESRLSIGSMISPDQ